MYTYCTLHLNVYSVHVTESPVLEEDIHPDSLQVAGASDALHCWPGHVAGRLALTLVVEVR